MGGAYTFLKSIRPKVNATARLEFELVYYDVAVQNINDYAKVIRILTCFMNIISQIANKMAWIFSLWVLVYCFEVLQ